MPFYASDDTIIAISTPLGFAGALGVIRLSGPEAVAITSRIFKPGGSVSLESVPSHTLHHGFIAYGETVVDEVMVAVMRKPHSYTGQDIVEISAHGGPVNLNQILQLGLAEGARLAQPGEFTFRAFMNGKMDLASAEAVADLIASKTELSARAAVYQLQGGFSRKIQEWRKKLVDLIASLEAALDHAEEDISFISHKELEASLLLLWEQIQQLQATADKGRFLRDGMKMAIIGRPNAGKSSLMNALLDRDRSIVTDVPGTTRDTIEETMDFRGFPLVIVDTAGLRAHTHDPVEKLGQERTIASMETSDMILWVVDASEPLTDADQHIAKLLAVHGTDKRVFILFNKIDKGTVVSNRDIDCLFPAFGKVSVSAMTRAGFLELENAVISTIYSDVTFSGEPPLTNVRHRDILRRAADALGEALAAHSDKETEEVTSFHLRNALNILGEITGETAVDEILKNIFSRFCVGK